MSSEGDSPSDATATDVGTTVPSLTSVFTPAPLCSSLFIDFCDKNACYAHLGSTSEGFHSDTTSMPQCYPETSVSTTIYTFGGTYGIETFTSTSVALTYSPGLFCPLGMTTATSLEFLDAVYCCYSDFVYTSGDQEDPTGYCVATLTEGTFLRGNSTIPFDPSQTDLFKSVASGYGGLNWTGPPTVEASASAIFLIGQHLLAGSLSISESPTNPSRTSQSSASTPQVVQSLDGNDARSSTNLKVGVGVGVSLGIIVLICLGFIFFKRYRRKRFGRLKNADVLANDKESDHNKDKPELEGSGANPGRFIKAELDALAIRAELEGSLGEECNIAGISVVKPELYGTAGILGGIGVYVKKKAELEAPSNRNAATPATFPPLNSAQDVPTTTNATSEPVELES